MHHKTRELLVGQRTQLRNALRGHFAEIGIITAQGPNNARALAAFVAENNDMVPACVRTALMPLVRQLYVLDEEVTQSDRTIQAITKADATARRLMSVPGVGPITASAIAASVQDVSVFSGPREFAAFLRVTPRQNSSGGRERRVSKVGDRYLRKLLVVGARAVLYHRKGHKDALRMGRSLDGNQAFQACRRGDRQQACPHRLRHHAQRHALRWRGRIRHRLPAMKTADQNRG